MTADETFYRQRDLERPADQHWPSDLEELRTFAEGRGTSRPVAFVGGGEHVRDGAIAESPWDAVRTERCDAIRALDRESNLVRVEAGKTWGELRDDLRAEDRTLDRYRLYPDGATVGGLLARHQPLEKQLWTGDLREGCVALTTASPGLSDYEYLPAPRKASGPDHRYLYVGGEGFSGAILEASLVVWPAQAARLVVGAATGIEEAVDIHRKLLERDIRASWCYWSLSAGEFEVALHAPRRALEGWVDGLREVLEDVRVEGGSGVRARRRELEGGIVPRRSSDVAEASREVVWNSDRLVGGEIDPSGYRELHLVRWSPRRVGGIAVMDETGGRPSGSTMVDRPLVGASRAPWSDWAVALDEVLDPEDDLAVGPASESGD